MGNGNQGTRSEMNRPFLGIKVVKRKVLNCLCWKEFHRSYAVYPFGKR